MAVIDPTDFFSGDPDAKAGVPEFAFFGDESGGVYSPRVMSTMKRAGWSMDVARRIKPSEETSDTPTIQTRRTESLTIYHTFASWSLTDSHDDFANLMTADQLTDLRVDVGRAPNTAGESADYGGVRADLVTPTTETNWRIESVHVQDNENNTSELTISLHRLYEDWTDEVSA